MELRRVLDRRLLQHQHMDDLLVHDCRWSVMVAGMAMRLARLLLLRLFCRLDRTIWSRVSCWIFRSQPCSVWYMGKHVACVQPSRHG